jgi:uncharacterized protein YjbI with pentapeptide repeats
MAAPLAAAAAPSGISAVPVCNGKYKGRRKPSPAELAEILKKHDEWLKDGGRDNPKLANDPRRANLCAEDLSGADLSGADLRNADLSGADLDYADLSGTDLSDAHLEGAHLGADLRGAHLDFAHLGGVHLEGADLTGAHLNGTDLTGADMTNADLIGADLMDERLTDADLSGARLDGANLRGAHLERAHLGWVRRPGAHLRGADLNNADLSDAHLSGADLSRADLTGADLRNADLNNADLSFADVADADFSFDPDLPPKAVPGFYTARHLQFVKFSDQSAGLVKLRGEFKGLGLRTQESQLTYAIRRSELSRKDFYRHYVHSWSERALNTVFFDWTCQYGMSPGWPLLLVMGFGVFFTVVYTLAQCFPSLGGIWVVWDENRVDKTKGDFPSQRLTGFPYDPSACPRGRTRFFLSVVMLAAYFSLLSALRIGWSGLNFGTWISRMQLREYSLHTTEWVRLVSGLQSLISVLLVALAILTYFGTPFEY